MFRSGGVTMSPRPLAHFLADEAVLLIIVLALLLVLVFVAGTAH